MRVVILYGSQTGTAQDVAEQVWRESKRYGFIGPVLSFDDYPIQQLVEETLAVFVVATTGNGDEPDNMKKAWKFLLRRSLPAKSLQHLQFACLGLGDSSYAKFNFAAKKLNKRLQQLGAKQILTVGLCDDQHDYGLSAVALPWISQLWNELSKSLALHATKIKNTKDIFKWNLKLLDEAPKSLHTNDSNQVSWPQAEPAHTFVLKQNDRTTATDHFQDVRFIKFAFPNDIIWQPGDVLDLRPCNADEQVTEFFDLVQEHNLNFAPNTRVQVTTAHPDMPVPLAYAQPLTMAQFVKYHWDLSAKPRQRFFELLAINCEDELEKEKLIEFTTAEGLDDMINYINRPRRTILEVLQDFRHATAKLTLPILFEMLPLIQARSFSIASVPAAGTLDLLVAVVEYKTKLSKPRLGLCSNWLKHIPVDSPVLGAIKSGTMLFPKAMHIPIIMIGPGTGIAPFRSLIQQRNQVQKQEPAAAMGPLIVFFGCRNRANDFHFSKDFEEWQSEKLIQLFVAFSRDQEHKIYVQHLIREQSELLRPLIQQQNAIILVAGSSKNMPKAVKEAFIEVLNGDAAYVEEMIKTQRYQEETWS